MDGNGEPVYDSVGGGMSPRLVPCTCKERDIRTKRGAYLQSIDGLRDSERVISFERCHDTPHMLKAKDIVDKRSGFLTITGMPGSGKTTALICAVNHARQNNLPAVYTTMADLLDYLRRAYNQDSDLNEDERWKLLVNVELLAVDELDQFNGTAWANDKFFRLIDERWRSLDTIATLFATNVDISQFAPKVASRLSDSRAEIMRAGGKDRRK